MPTGKEGKVQTGKNRDPKIYNGLMGCRPRVPDYYLCHNTCLISNINWKNIEPQLHDNSNGLFSWRISQGETDVVVKNKPCFAEL